MGNKHISSSLRNSLLDITYSGSDNVYVRNVNELLNDKFENLADSQPKVFNANPLADQFSINLNGISDELSDMTLKFAPKEVRINSLERKIEFIVTRLF